MAPDLRVIEDIFKYWVGINIWNYRNNKIRISLVDVVHETNLKTKKVFRYFSWTTSTGDPDFVISVIFKCWCQLHIWEYLQSPFRGHQNNWKIFNCFQWKYKYLFLLHNFQISLQIFEEKASQIFPLNRSFNTGFFILYKNIKN